MNFRHVASCGLVCAALVLTGCDSGRKTPGTVGVRVVNVAPGFSELGFRREQRDEVARVPFKSTQEISYAADTYDFYIFERALTSAASRFWEVNQKLEEDHFYTFVLTESGSDVIPVVIDSTAAPAADAQIYALHAAAGFPAMDLYLERPGVGIAGATPRGTFNLREQIAARTIPSGDYELWLTAAGDPANVLLATSTITLPAGVTSGFVVAPDSDPAAPKISVVVVQPTSSVRFDRNAPGEVRVINGATDMAPRDFAIDGQFSPPLFSAVPFAAPSTYASVPVASMQINVTPPGNPGVLELTSTFVSGASLRSTILFGGAAGTLTHLVANDDGRRYHGEAKLLLLNVASQFESIEFVLVPPDATDATTALPVAVLAAPGSTFTYGGYAPGDYDLYLRSTGTTTLLSGPTRITLAARGVYGVLGINGPDTATAEVRLFDDFP